MSPNTHKYPSGSVLMEQCSVDVGLFNSVLCRPFCLNVILNVSLEIFHLKEVSLPAADCFRREFNCPMMVQFFFFYPQ